MKRRINPLYVIYEFLVWGPLAVTLTALTSIVTIAITPFSKSAKWGYYPAIIWSRLMCAIALIRIEIKGRELYDTNKSYIFVSNHQSIYDIFPIYGYIGSRFVWIMKKEVQKIPLVGKACESVGHIFIDRSSPMRAKRSMDVAEKNLRNGLSVVVFPEGHRTRDGKIAKFKRGAFSIAADLHLPVVPITLNGAYDVLPAGSWFLKPGKIQLIFHEPLDTQNLTSENLNEFIDKTHAIIEKDFVE